MASLLCRGAGDDPPAAKPETRPDPIGAVVGAKTFNIRAEKFYHLSSCTTAHRLTADRRVHFDDIAAALKAGFKPCSDCRPAGSVVGETAKKRYHFEKCRFLAKVDTRGRIALATATEAVNKGYEPCPVCKPTTAAEDAFRKEQRKRLLSRICG
jgi:methylphosphotriester-DNA--protein-cysteine methyltransferase